MSAGSPVPEGGAPHCIVCGDDPGPLTKVLDLGTAAVAGYLVDSCAAALAAPRFALGLGRCDGCGLVQQYGTPDAVRRLLIEEVYADYHVTYSASAAVPGFLAEFVDRAIAAAGAGPGDRAVEIGSNDGRGLIALRERGLDPTGFEPARSLAECSASLGFEVRAELFDGAAAERFVRERGPVRLVLARHTLEHAFDPCEFLAAMATLLDERGRVVVEVPYLPLQLADARVDGMGHQHQSFFAVNSVTAVMERAGLAPINVRLVPADGGSFVVTAARAGCDARPSAGLRALAAWEEGARATATAAFVPVAARLGRLRESVRQLLDDPGDAAPIVGYGAGSKGQLLASILGFEPASVAGIVDDTPGLPGRFMPGSGVKVMAAAEAAAIGARTVLVTAPTHVAEIAARVRSMSPDRLVLAIVPELRPVVEA